MVGAALEALIIDWLPPAVGATAAVRKVFDSWTRGPQWG